MYKKLIIILLLIVPIGYSHLSGGEDKEVDDFIVDLGWEPDFLVVGELSTFAVNLLDNNLESNLQVKTRSVWVRISSGNHILFSGTFISDPNVVFSYTFPSKGDYEIFLRFEINDDKNVETSFVVDVKGSDGKKKGFNYNYVGYGVLLLIMVYLWRRNKVFKKE